MSEKLVTKDLLKAFGDKSKKIFKPATAVISVEETQAGDILIVPTDINYNTAWSINIGVDCVSLTDTFEDIKFIGNACLTDQGVLGKGVSFGNEIVGVSFYQDLKSGNLSLLFSFNIAIVSASVTVVNCAGSGTSNVIISNMQVLGSINTQQDLPIAQENTLGVVIDQSGNEYEGNVGKIVNLGSSELSFYMNVPGNYTSDISGVKTKVTNGDYVPKVNNSKWADYILMPYNIQFKEGDLEAFAVYFGGDIYTTKHLTGPKINNSVTGYEGYQEGDLVGRVKVNSKGLVTAVEKDPELPKATETTLGVIQVGYKENLIDKQYPVKLDADGNAYVHIPWNDTDTWNKVADSDNLGLIKIGYAENDKNYPVKLDSENKAYVNVPWVSGEYDIATKDNAGLIKIGYSSNNVLHLPVKLDSSGKAYAVKHPDIVTGYVNNTSLSGLNNYDYYYILPPCDGVAYDHFSDSYLQVDWTEPLLDTFTITIDAISQPQSYSATKTIRFENPYEDHSITVIVKKDDSVRVCNMFNADIMDEGVTLLPGKTIELVFTYWHYNNVTFNGSFSV